MVKIYPNFCYPIDTKQCINGTLSMIYLYFYITESHKQTMGWFLHGGQAGDTRVVESLSAGPSHYSAVLYQKQACETCSGCWQDRLATILSRFLLQYSTGIYYHPLRSIVRPSRVHVHYITLLQLLEEC